MPILFNEETNSFEGENLSGETLSGFDFSVFGGLITNSGDIAGAIVGNSSAGIEITNELDANISKAAGSPYAVTLLGNGGRNFFNDGTVFGVVRFGNGWDTLQNSGLIEGQIRMGGGNDRVVNQLIPGIEGGETTGTVTGTIYMGNGNDVVLNLGTLNDVRLGGGDDRYSVTDLFGDGLSLSTGTAGDVRGDSGNDDITGGDDSDHFYGGTGNDSLYGNGGKDQLHGNGGDDFISGGAGNDKISGGSGNDTIEGGDNNDRIFGGADNDDLFAGRGNDLISGGQGDDFISGDAGNDRLVGNNGNDTILGGTGHDTMIGGAGADVFLFNGSSGRDEIIDFSANDRIDMLFSFGGGATYQDVIDNTVFVNGDAVIDLSSVFNLNPIDGSTDNGSFLTINNVTLADLDASAFGLQDDIFVVG